LISVETVDIDLTAQTVYSDGELLFAQKDQELSVFKINESNGLTSFDQFATVKLHSDEVLVGFEVGVAKIRSAYGARSIHFKPIAKSKGQLTL
jgi:hypothetical protein